MYLDHQRHKLIAQINANTDWKLHANVKIQSHMWALLCVTVAGTAQCFYW
jgi:hypothetical protein